MKGYFFAGSMPGECHEEGGMLYATGKELWARCPTWVYYSDRRPTMRLRDLIVSDLDLFGLYSFRLDFEEWCSFVHALG